MYYHIAKPLSLYERSGRFRSGISHANIYVIADVNARRVQM